MRLPMTVMALLLGIGGPSFAGSSCSGTFHSRLLQKLPVPTIVAMDVRDPSPRNLRLAGRFMDGMRHAGVSTGGTPNVALEVTARIELAERAPGPGRPGTPSDFARHDRTGSTLSRERPAMPLFPPLRHDNEMSAPTLFLRAELVDPSTSKVLWLGIVHCAIGSSDERQRAYELGVLIGHALGRTIGPQAF